jgi:hypothetical protein
VTKNGAAQTGNTTTNSYRWWDGALQSKINYVSGSTNHNSTFYYDNSGNLSSINIQDGRPRTVSFINDAYGQILQRDEADGNVSTGTNNGDPRELHFYFNGLRVGDISNNGTSDVDYATSIAQHVAVPGTGPFRGGSASGISYADFDQSYDPINGLTYESTAGRYTVEAGDTLENVALKLWGDAAFWYMIADANGLSGSEALVEGMILTIPHKVHNARNNAAYPAPALSHRDFGVLPLPLGPHVAAEQHLERAGDRHVGQPQLGVVHVEAEQGERGVVASFREPRLDLVRPETVDQRGVVIDDQLAVDAAEQVMSLGDILRHRGGPLLQSGDQAVVAAGEEPDRAVGLVELSGHRLAVVVGAVQADHQERAFFQFLPETVPDFAVGRHDNAPLLMGA